MRTRLRPWLNNLLSFGKKTWGFVTAPLHQLAGRLRQINLTDMRQVSSWVIWIAIVALLIFLVFDLPPRMVDWGAKLDSVDGQSLNNLRHDYEIRHRETLLKILAGLFAVIGLIVAWHRSKAAAKQADAATQSQINERYTNAITQLADDKIEIRLGGIYALEQIMRNSGVHHWTIVEVLSAYIRERAPWPPKREESLVAELDIRPWKMGKFHDGKAEETDDKNIKPPQDIQAALSVIVRRPQDRDEPGQVDLRNVDLRGADFRVANDAGGYLPKALLDMSNLGRAKLDKANLQEAQLWHATLQQTILRHANLQKTKFGRANLEQAILRHANLQHAHLQDANLQHAHLQRANLQHAHLQRANLQHAQLLNANLKLAQLWGANLKLAQLWNANLKLAQLWNANLKLAQLLNANLLETKGVSTDQLLKAETLCESKLPPDLEQKLRELKPELFEEPISQ